MGSLKNGWNKYVFLETSISATYIQTDQSNLETCIQPISVMYTHFELDIHLTVYTCTHVWINVRMHAYLKTCSFYIYQGHEKKKHEQQREKPSILWERHLIVNSGTYTFKQPSHFDLSPAKIHGLLFLHYSPVACHIHTLLCTNTSTQTQRHIH